jgi:hypothetical protein
VIWQKFVIDHVLVRADERQHGPDVLLIVVHSRNERGACDELEVRERLVGFLEIREDDFCLVTTLRVAFRSRTPSDETPRKDAHQRTDERRDQILKCDLNFAKT